MLPIKLYELGKVRDDELTRVVCVSTYNGKFVYSKHKECGTWEIPGGHIEAGETWLEAAKRELFEETGAIEIDVEPICLYLISSYGLLCYANIKKFENLPDFEMDMIGLFDCEPDNLTYPETHHLFYEIVKEKKKL